MPACLFQVERQVLRRKEAWCAALAEDIQELGLPSPFCIFKVERPSEVFSSAREHQDREKRLLNA
jgi:hypothetical protein